jgi:hypothetical protein
MSTDAVLLPGGNIKGDIDTSHSTVTHEGLVIHDATDARRRYQWPPESGRLHPLGVVERKRIATIEGDPHRGRR